jgi:hypothetical protein
MRGFATQLATGKTHARKGAIACGHDTHEAGTGRRPRRQERFQKLDRMLKRLSCEPVHPARQASRNCVE